MNSQGTKDNPMFKEFEEKMKNIKKPGDSVTIVSLYTYSFFKTFPKDANYRIFKGRSLYHLYTDKTYHNCTIFHLPLMKKTNYMSKSQVKCVI